MFRFIIIINDFDVECIDCFLEQFVYVDLLIVDVFNVELDCV